MAGRARVGVRFSAGFLSELGLGAILGAVGLIERAGVRCSVGIVGLSVHEGETQAHEFRSSSCMFVPDFMTASWRHRTRWYWRRLPGAIDKTEGRSMGVEMGGDRSRL